MSLAEDLKTQQTAAPRNFTQSRPALHRFPDSDTIYLQAGSAHVPPSTTTASVHDLPLKSGAAAQAPQPGGARGNPTWDLESSLDHSAPRGEEPPGRGDRPAPRSNTRTEVCDTALPGLPSAF